MHRQNQCHEEITAEKQAESSTATQGLKRLAAVPETQIRMLIEDGHTDEFMCEFFGVPLDTWLRFKQLNPQLSAAASCWKTNADSHVETALYKRAVGYDYQAIKVLADGRRVKHTQHVIPDVAACRMWLRNRLPEEWNVESRMGSTVAAEVRVDMRHIDLEDRIMLLSEHRLSQTLDGLLP